MLICPKCFSVSGLQKRIVEIRPNYPDLKCDFHPAHKGVPVKAVSDILDPIIRETYIGGISDPYDLRSGIVSLDDLLSDLTGVDEHDIGEALISQLIEDDFYWPPDGEEPFYSEDYVYESNNDSLGQHDRLWENFRKRLLHDQRFFNADARRLIAEIFDGVHQQRDHRGQGPVYMIEPGQPQAEFLRARVADTKPLQAEIKADLARNLGPPPERLRRAGRLNPSGISAFYGAFDLDSCVAELRPAVGSIVAYARFAITRPICVLDTTRFEAKPKEVNIFAKGARTRAAQWQFMQSFMRQIAQPISPNDEHLDYIPTQAVAEYLVHHHRFKFEGQDRTIDAIIYRSAQRPEGKNIAILGRAAVVGTPPPTKSAQTAVSDDDPFAWVINHSPVLDARIIPVHDTYALRRIAGAQFETYLLSHASEFEDGNDNLEKISANNFGEDY